MGLTLLVDRSVYLNIIALHGLMVIDFPYLL